MSANDIYIYIEREREIEEKGESGLGGVIKAQASRTAPRRPNSYAWLPGRCATGSSQQANFSGSQTKRTPGRIQAGVLSRHFSSGLHPNMPVVYG